MINFDLTGQKLPSITVLGAEVYPPDLKSVYALPRVISSLIAAVETAENGEKVDFSNVTDNFRAMVKINSIDKRFAPKELKKMKVDKLFLFLIKYAGFLADLTKNERFKIPEIRNADTDDVDIGYILDTHWEKLAADYSGLTVHEVFSLNYVDFLILRRDAFIFNMSQTKKGRELLEAAYLLEQTEPNRAALRKEFGRS